MYITSVFGQEPFNSCILTTIIDNVERNYTRTLHTDEDPEDTRHNITSLFTYVNKIKQTKQIRIKTTTHVTKLLLKTLACISIKECRILRHSLLVLFNISLMLYVF